MRIPSISFVPRLFVFSTALLVSSYVMAEEGMWTFDNLPLEKLKAGYQFTADQKWTGHVMRAAVNLGGCSASFISPEGLVLTNHHCVSGCLQQVSSATKNYLKDGFLARKREEEMKCPTTEASRLEEISDVTKEVNAATKGLTGEAYKNALNAVNAKIAAACVGENSATVRCNVVALYQGGQYHLYRYARFSDVRLVWAPENAAGDFGGDPDNFNFPRYDLDASILRAYENGKPIAVKDFFPLNKNGAKEGELVFVTGNPGRTNRQMTVTQLETFRDVRLISRIRRGYELRGMLTQYGKLGTEQARVSRNELHGLENGLKVASGELDALQSVTHMQKKRADEESLRKFVAGNPALKKETGDAWDAIANVQTRYRDMAPEYETIEEGRAFNTRFFNLARTLVRGSEERAKPNGERMPEYSSTRMPLVERQLFSPAPIYPEYEQAKLEWSLTKMREWLGADDPFVTQILGKESPAQVAKRLIEGTKLGDAALRKALWQGDRGAIEKSDDSFLKLVRDIDAQARAIRKRLENDVTAIEQKNAELIARARFAQLGSKAYPDATGSLRLSYGAVHGWTERGKPVAPFTTIAGAYARHAGVAPYALPDSWIAQRDKMNLAQPYNFVTTNDIIGGNSGSPMINRNAEIVGLAFDGNTHSHGGAFWYDASVNRTVGVVSGAILDALKNIYAANELLAELPTR